MAKGRGGKRGGSPQRREKKTPPKVVGERRKLRQAIAKFCHRWHSAWPGRIPPKVINRLKEEAAKSIRSTE